MRVLPYSGKRVKVMLNGFPLQLAKADDAVMLEGAEDAFQEPAMDLNGGGLHIENADGHGTITLQIPPNATPSIQFLEAFRKARISAPTLVGRDLGTQKAAFVANDVVCSNPARWGRGNTRGNLEYNFTYISADVTEDGALVLPV